MSVLDVEIDDFDSVIQYGPDRALFTTPDPSKEDQTQAALAAGYSKGTYHLTSVSGQFWSLNFTGSHLWIYGSSGPDFGTFNLQLDENQTQTLSAWAPQPTNSTLLWETDVNAETLHALTVTNGNASMLLDRVRVTVDIAASGSSFSNATVEETDAVVHYTGQWGNNKSPLFSGGGSTYTNEDGASAMFSFEGSTAFFYGDTNANHGLYSVALDDKPPVTLQSATGCGLGYQTQGLCERTEPNLLYYAAYLGQGNHTVVFSNIAGPNQTFFDFDRMVYYTPTQYFTAQSSPNPTTSGSPTPIETNNGSGRIAYGTPTLAMLVTIIVWLLH